MKYLNDSDANDPEVRKRIVKKQMAVMRNVDMPMISNMFTHPDLRSDFEKIAGYITPEKGEALFDFMCKQIGLKPDSEEKLQGHHFLFFLLIHCVSFQSHVESSFVAKQEGDIKLCEEVLNHMQLFIDQFRSAVDSVKRSDAVANN